jgi:2-dehydropantoate 2-reductase
MKFLVFGTGGVGGYFGGRLAQAGEDVTFVARGEHLRAIRASGLRVDSISGDFRVRPAHAVDSLNGQPQPEVILLAVKAFQLDDALQQLIPFVGDETVLLPLLNGVEHVDALVREFGQEAVLGGMCRISAFVAAPGYIQHVSIAPYIAFGELAGGKSARVMKIFNAFKKIQGSTFEAHEDIVRAMWEKYLLISAFSGVGAVTRQSLGVFRAIPESRAMFRRALEEVVQVANARGVALDDDSVQAVMDRIDTLQADTMASMQKDIMEGRPSELEAQTGALVRMARESGVYAPTHEFIYASLLPMEKAAQEGRR